MRIEFRWMERRSRDVPFCRCRKRSDSKVKVGPQAWWERPTDGRAGQGQGDRTSEKARDPTSKCDEVSWQAIVTCHANSCCTLCAKRLMVFCRHWVRCGKTLLFSWNVSFRGVFLFLRVEIVMWNLGVFCVAICCILLQIATQVSVFGSVYFCDDYAR